MTHFGQGTLGPRISKIKCNGIYADEFIKPHLVLRRMKIQIHKEINFSNASKHFIEFNTTELYRNIHFVLDTFS